MRPLPNKKNNAAKFDMTSMQYAKLHKKWEVLPMTEDRKVNVHESRQDMQHLRNTNNNAGTFAELFYDTLKENKPVDKVREGPEMHGENEPADKFKEGLENGEKEDPADTFEEDTSATVRYKDIIVDAIDEVEEDIEITLENDVGAGKCGKVVTNFSVSGINKEVIADHLDKEHALFSIESMYVYITKISSNTLENVWKTATLYMSCGSIQIMVGKHALVTELYTTLNFQIKIQQKCDSSHEFTLGFPCDKTLLFTCRAKDTSLRNEIMVTGKTFQLKSLIEPYRYWIKPMKGWVKLNIGTTRSGISGSIDGVVRDEAGKWCIGFWGKCLKETTRIELEIAALKEGLLALEECKNKKKCGEILGFIIETRCEDLEYVLEDETYDLLLEPFHTIADECKILLKKLGTYKYRLIGPDIRLISHICIFCLSKSIYFQFRE